MSIINNWVDIMHPKMKIIIFLSVILSISVFFLAQTSFFRGIVENTTATTILILSIILIVLGLGRGIFLVTNKEVKKKRIAWF